MHCGITMIVAHFNWNVCVVLVCVVLCFFISHVRCSTLLSHIVLNGLYKEIFISLMKPPMRLLLGVK